MKPEDPALPDSFYKEEWREVIQSQGISSVDQYMRASRLGRGRSLDRKSRNLVWPVFEEFRNLLEERKLKEPEDAFRDARSVLSSSSSALPYKCVIVDEAQDFGTEAFKLISVLSQSSHRDESEKGVNSLFIVGDSRQRIYGRKVVLGRCGIEIRGRSEDFVSITGPPKRLVRGPVEYLRARGLMTWMVERMIQEAIVH